MRLPIAYEGRKFVLLAAVMELVLYFWFPWISLIFLLPLLFILNFFRDPERHSMESSECVLSPADGRVIDIVSSPGEFDQQFAYKISIFMNLLDVHVNRAPLDATVLSLDHFPGSFLPADSAAAAEKNEHVDIRLATDRSIILVRQIAGLVARRIIPYIKPDQSLKRSDRIGIIMFGSRVDIFLHRQIRLEVGIGDKVKAGISRIATQLHD